MKTAQQSCAATTPAPRNLSHVGKTAIVTDSTCDADLKDAAMLLGRPAASAAPVTRRLSSCLRDARGQRVTGGDRTVIAAIDQFADTVLRRGRCAETILDAAIARPDCPMAQACGAVYHLLDETRSGIEQAKSLLEQARRGQFAATDREVMFVRAISAIAESEPRLADSFFLALAETAPEDLLAGYIGHLHFLNHGRFDAMLAHAQLLRRANPFDPFALGMLSFALEEAGAADAALDAALAANAVDPSIAWVHHTVAHVFKTQGLSAEGITWLMQHAHHWESCGSSMFTHNWWHAQLLALDIDAPTRALDLYDHLIAAEATRSVSSFVNASSLLARLELRDIDVGSRWLPLAEEARRRVGEHVLPFIDLHYGITLGYAGDLAGCTALKRSMALHASHQRGELREAWAFAGVPLTDAVIAGCFGDWRNACRHFACGLPKAMLIGGSRLQRELLHEFRAHAGLRADPRSAAGVRSERRFESAISALAM